MQSCARVTDRVECLVVLVSRIVKNYYKCNENTKPWANEEPNKFFVQT